MAYSRADDNQDTRKGQIKYYLPRIDLKKYVIIDGRNFYDNPIKSDIEKYRELKKNNDLEKEKIILQDLCSTMITSKRIIN